MNIIYILHCMQFSENANNRRTFNKQTKTSFECKTEQNCKTSYCCETHGVTIANRTELATDVCH